jgi:hypothetical protein
MRPAARLARIASPARATPLRALPPRRPVPRTAAARAAAPTGAAAPVVRSAPGRQPRRHLRLARRPPLRVWPLAIGTVVTMVATIVLGLGLRHLVNVGPPLLVSAGLPATLAVPVAVAPVWGVILAGIRVAMGRAPSEAGDEAEPAPARRG